MMVLSAVDESLKTVLSDVQFLSSIAASVAKIVEENLQKTFTDINNRVLNCEAKIAEFEKQSHTLVEVNKNSIKEVDRLQQYSRRNNIRMFGVPVLKGENMDEVVLRLFNYNMKLNVDKSVIDRVHRLGNIKNGKQQIIIKFVSYRDRATVLYNRKLLKGTGVYLTEDLTAHRLGLLKKSQMDFGKENAWTMDGTIWVKRNGKKYRVLSQKDLEGMQTVDTSDST